ncbi:2-aminoethylphosphonate--pyruvate transaminase [Xanthomonas translucens]|uniref:2-aminoethylphosphonate--pyruvate transaminase n=3 Tax=Xanthomonas campestris pv. translucens TaxID=343 RepID=UPI0002A7855C|nr:2-aminoethylphosphonate--pyruvate transaminase [Xanthomonas translucens]ELQ15851.1 serine-pyruvate aminotransferase [Xanthomonas translucens DAR61454]MBC3972311.1 2-aminoethylphosphonate--pyruvate transaminase [Xanthomonas translucens pv. undulosa]MCT8269377.1 2-aminoethylphosphonate--pyruvate transaminase [Xanthomonas translucens pv. undulosa]MCT8281998.1 2-aminoethylphosphonate--pyruvate transaminase [Xanthomonas translucens pv. undulosa]MCT8316690.1 2-aminoethylphosphonate--pyruvate tran
MCPEKYFLMTPGPLALSDEVKSQMQFDMGSRDESFRITTALMRNLAINLVEGQESHSVIPIQGSGTYGIEAALATFICQSDKPLVCINGIYGERMLKILQLRGIRAASMKVPSDKPLSVADIVEYLDKDRTITHICFVHCETTTGVINPLNEIVKLAKRYGVITIVDAMSSFGAVDISVKISPFDVLVTSSNKCIEGPPGISLVIAKLALLKRKKTHPVNSFVLDVRDQWKILEETGEWRSTPPTHVVQACAKALELLTLESVANRRKRYCLVREEIIRATERYAVPLLSARARSPVCLALTAKGVIDTEEDFNEFYRHLVRYNLYIYAKFHVQTRSFRIGCIGAIKPAWILVLAKAFREFFEDHKHRLVEAALDDPALESGAA